MIALVFLADHTAAVWNIVDVSFEMDEDITDHPILTVIVTTPSGQLKVMAEPERQDRRLVLHGLDIQGVSANVLGQANLRVLADAVLKEWDVDEVVVKGAVRTTGTTPGRTPHPVRFTRRSPFDSPARGSNEPSD